MIIAITIHVCSLNSAINFYIRTKFWPGKVCARHSLGAKTSIYWEIFTLVDDLAGKPFYRSFVRKSQAGDRCKINCRCFLVVFKVQRSYIPFKNSGVKFLIFNNFRTRVFFLQIGGAEPGIAHTAKF